MAKAEPVNWQPISQMPLVASMISTSLAETREHLGTLTKAKDRPHILDDATIDRVKQVHTEQMEFVGIYAQQISRWRAEKPSPARISELDRMETQNQHLREVTKAVLDLADELRKGTIDRVLRYHVAAATNLAFAAGGAPFTIPIVDVSGESGNVGAACYWRAAQEAIGIGWGGESA